MLPRACFDFRKCLRRKVNYLQLSMEQLDTISTLNMILHDSHIQFQISED